MGSAAPSRAAYEAARAMFRNMKEAGDDLSRVADHLRAGLEGPDGPAILTFLASFLARSLQGFEVNPETLDP